MMTIINIRRRTGARAARYATFCLLAFLAVLCQSHQAQAQWVTQGTNTTTTNNVGIGTTTPQTSLQVTTSTTSVTRGITSEQTSNDGNSALFTFSKNRAGGAVLNGDNIGSLFASAFDGSANQTPTRLRFFVDGPVAVGSVPTAIQFFTGSNGVGTERLRISSAGNVGIGTSSPERPLVVAADASGIPLRVYRNVSNAGWGTGIEWAFNNSAGSVTNYAYVNSTIVSNTAGAENGTLGFFTVKSGAITQGAILDQNGNFGIGTTAPATKLHVVGDVTVTGNISAKYQDVAEWVPSTQKLSAGTVVVLDKHHANHVNASTSAYDTGVAGVVSAQPGIALGEAGEDKALVATTGRVKVRVDATRAPIQIGDLIVTSDVAGVAMKSEPISFGGVAMHRPGTIIGKALESLDKGTGEILVLLSLQ
jgi:hypothetical protein